MSSQSITIEWYMCSPPRAQQRQSNQTFLMKGKGHGLGCHDRRRRENTVFWPPAPYHDPHMRQEPRAQGSGRQLTSISVTLEVTLLHYRPAYLKQTNRPWNTKTDRKPKFVPLEDLKFSFIHWFPLEAPAFRGTFIHTNIAQPPTHSRCPSLTHTDPSGQAKPSHILLTVLQKKCIS